MLPARPNQAHSRLWVPQAQTHPTRTAPCPNAATKVAAEATLAVTIATVATKMERRTIIKQATADKVTTTMGFQGPSRSARPTRKTSGTTLVSMRSKTSRTRSRIASHVSTTPRRAALASTVSQVARITMAKVATKRVEPVAGMGVRKEARSSNSSRPRTSPRRINLKPATLLQASTRSRWLLTTWSSCRISSRSSSRRRTSLT